MGASTFRGPVSGDHDLKKSEASATRTGTTGDGYDAEKELEDELEKDLEGLNLDGVDTSDVNLDEDLDIDED